MKIALLAFFAAVFVSHSALAQDLALIAHYPLNSTANDTTGSYGPMTLQNTVFQNGGLYCNGIYIGDDPTGSHAITPNLVGLRFRKFAMRVEFKVTIMPTPFAPVIIGGNSYRWMGFMVFNDTTICLKYNNSNYLNSTFHFTPNTWHEAYMEYDSTAEVGRIYLDSILVATQSFAIVHGENKNFGVVDFGSGKTFGGYIRNLRIYSVSPPSAVAERGLPAAFDLLQNYPNPFNPHTNIRFMLPFASHAQLRVYNILGQHIRTLVDGWTEPGEHSVQFDAGNLPSGVYVCHLRVNGKAHTRLLVLMR